MINILIIVVLLVISFPAY
ncbi:type I toxin-antitoxin system Ibs family toxin [Klebsiella pneumoniae]|nr:type I toxin-antitoxin system Ibs family toxin [Klebsiella pneumoniae]MCL1462523.1 type I toxin-antitoxin system Ibs family toxin [Klebsiella pneumoniae]